MDLIYSSSNYVNTIIICIKSLENACYVIALQNKTIIGCHHKVHFLSEFIAEFESQLKSLENSSILLRVPSTRNIAGECSSVVIINRVYSGLDLVQKAFAIDNQNI